MVFSLILKVKNPMRVVDFRPISVCTVQYKLITKCLANRLKGFLEDVI